MKVLIADDEPLARDRLRTLLEECPGWQICAEAADGDQAWAMCQAQQPDLLLLDIRMPGLDGLQLARKLSELNPPPAVIFCTAYAEHALNAFQTIATAYLLKPVTRAKLRAALAKVQATTRTQASVQESGPELHLESQGRLWRLPLAKLLMLRAEQKYTEVHHLDGVDLSNESLSALEEQFPQLLRVHRNALVNPDFIAGMEPAPAGGRQLRLRHIQDPIAISRRHASTVRQRLQALEPSRGA